mmetsp:Transcript_35157/g.109889  ORF Transcript_35157/g.109889 Transcript_35157/m.109889 type:complete len:82 (+) Transcript_35157:362-607(+)
MFGSTRPKPISVPDLVCQHLDGQARVSALMYKDSAHGNKIGGALAMMKDLQAQRRRVQHIHSFLSLHIYTYTGYLGGMPAT